MTTKEYLKQISRFDKRIKNKLAEKYYLETLLKSPTYGDRVQTSPKNDPIGEIVVKIAKIESQIDALVDECVDFRQHIVEQIEGLERDDYYDVLHARFVQCLDFDDIPDVIHMSRRNMFYVYNKALAEFENLYGEEYLNIALNCTKKSDIV